MSNERDDHTKKENITQGVRVVSVTYDDVGCSAREQETSLYTSQYLLRSIVK